MSLDFYDKWSSRLPTFGALLVSLLVIVACLWSWVVAMADCDRCPPGSRGHLVRGWFGPECICEVAR